MYHFNTNSKKSPLMSLSRSPRQNHKKSLSRRRPITSLRSPRQSHKKSLSRRRPITSLRFPRQNHKMSPMQNIPISKKCDHTKNFSCFHSEQTVIVNGKRQHNKQNKCKCYECGMEF